MSPSVANGTTKSGHYICCGRRAEETADSDCRLQIVDSDCRLQIQIANLKFHINKVQQFDSRPFLPLSITMTLVVYIKFGRAQA